MGDRSRWWNNLWLRAALVHPVVFVAPWVAICLALGARNGSELGDVAWGFWVVPLGAIASWVATAIVAARPGRARWERTGLVLVGLFAGGAALVLGYECPF